MDRRVFLGAGAAGVAALKLGEYGVASSRTVDKSLNTLPAIIVKDGWDGYDDLAGLATIGWKAFAGGEKYGSFEVLPGDPSNLSADELSALINETLAKAESAMKHVWTGVPISYEAGSARAGAYASRFPFRAVENPDGSVYVTRG